MKASKPAAGTASYWHPNFRIADALPDTKVIRTSFVVNAAAFAFMAAVVAFVAQREMAVSAVKDQIVELEAKIAASTPRYREAQKYQKDFAAADAKAKEIGAFLASPMVASDFLVVISETLPRLITLDSIEMYGEGVRLRGTVVGASERSAPLAKEYAEKLAANPVLAAQMESIRLNTQFRDQAGDRFTFEIELKLKTKK